MIHMEYYLIVSTIMMFVGIYGFVTRRNLLAMLISVELILKMCIRDRVRLRDARNGNLSDFLPQSRADGQ